MSAHIVITCNGHREKERCLGALHSRWLSPILAGEQAAEAGWRVLDNGQHLCPSSGHDEDNKSWP